MRRLAIAVGVVGALWLATVAADAQVTTVTTLLRAAAGLVLSTASVDAADTADAANAVDADGQQPAFVAYTIVLPQDERVVSLPSGAIMPGVGHCPSGWEAYADAEGEPLYFPFGLLVDQNQIPHPGGAARTELLRACVKQ